MLDCIDFPSFAMAKLWLTENGFEERGSGFFGSQKQTGGGYYRVADVFHPYRDGGVARVSFWLSIA